MKTEFAELRREALAALAPPRKLALSEWVEGHVHLPASVAAQPGRMRLWPQQREMLDTIGDGTTERVTILKSARVGATQAMVAAPLVTSSRTTPPRSLPSFLPRLTPGTLWPLWWSRSLPSPRLSGRL